MTSQSVGVIVDVLPWFTSRNSVTLTQEWVVLLLHYKLVIKDLLRLWKVGNHGFQYLKMGLMFWFLTRNPNVRTLLWLYAFCPSGHTGQLGNVMGTRKKKDFIFLTCLLNYIYITPFTWYIVCIKYHYTVHCTMCDQSEINTHPMFVLESILSQFVKILNPPKWTLQKKITNLVVLTRTAHLLSVPLSDSNRCDSILFMESDILEIASPPQNTTII